MRSGDTDAFAEIWHRHAHTARRFARRLVDPDDVDEVVANAFVRVLNALRQGKGPRDQTAAYLMVAVRTAAFATHRETRRQGNLRALIDAQPAERVVERPVRDDDLEAALRALPPHWRKALWWSAVEGMTGEEIGARLGINAAAVASLTYRARGALRDGYARRGRSAAQIDARWDRSA